MADQRAFGNPDRSPAEVGAQVRDKAQEAGAQVRDKAQEAGAQVRDKAQEMVRQGEETPLTLTSRDASRWKPWSTRLRMAFGPSRCSLS